MAKDTSSTAPAAPVEEAEQAAVEIAETVIADEAPHLLAEAEAEAAKVARNAEIALTEALNNIRAHFGHHPQVAEAVAARDLDAATAAVNAVTAPTSEAEAQ